MKDFLGKNITPDTTLKEAININFEKEIASSFRDAIEIVLKTHQYFLPQSIHSTASELARGFGVNPEIPAWVLKIQQILEKEAPRIG